MNNEMMKENSGSFLLLLQWVKILCHYIRIFILWVAFFLDEQGSYSYYRHRESRDSVVDWLISPETSFGRWGTGEWMCGWLFKPSHICFLFCFSWKPPKTNREPVYVYCMFYRNKREVGLFENHNIYCCLESDAQNIHVFFYLNRNWGSTAL